MAIPEGARDLYEQVREKISHLNKGEFSKINITDIVLDIKEAIRLADGDYYEAQFLLAYIYSVIDDPEESINYASSILTRRDDDPLIWIIFIEDKLKLNDHHQIVPACQSMCACFADSMARGYARPFDALAMLDLSISLLSNGEDGGKRYHKIVWEIWETLTRADWNGLEDFEEIREAEQVARRLRGYEYIANM